MVRESTLEVGDRVLVCNLHLHNKHKLADRWEPVIYLVTKWMGDLPFYSVKPEKEEGSSRTLHRDHLLPCGFLPKDERDEQKTKSSPTKHRMRQQSAIQQDEEAFASEDDNDESWNTMLSYQMSQTRGLSQCITCKKTKPALLHASKVIHFQELKNYGFQV